MQLTRETGEQVNVPDRPVGDSTAGPGVVDTGVEAREKPANTVMGGGDDDDDRGRELAAGTSSVVEVAQSRVLSWVIEGVAAHSSRSMLRMV